MTRKMRGSLLEKIGSKFKVVAVAGAIGLSGLINGCDSASQNALFSAMAGANADLAGMNGKDTTAEAWRGLANVSGTMAQQQSDLNSASAGRTQININNGNNSEDGDYIVVYNSKTGRNERWNKVSPEEFKKDIGVPQVASAKIFDTETFMRGLSNLTVVVSYNYWTDLDGNGEMLKRDETINYDEFIGLGKHQFRKGEKISFIFECDSSNLRHVNYEMIGPGGKILWDMPLEIKNPTRILEYDPNENPVLPEGDYVASWNLDGKSINSWKFEIID